MNSYYNTFKREKLLNPDLLTRYCKFVCIWFEKEYNQEINEITIGWANDDMIQDNATIVFRHRLKQKEKLLINFLK